MKKIRKIIAVLNDFSMLDEVLNKTFTFSHIYDAHVEILYVHETPLFEIPDLFTKENTKIFDTAIVKKELEKKVTMYTTKYKPVIFVQIDDTANRVLAVAKEEKETIIIAAFHPETTENMIHKVFQTVLVIKTKIDTYEKISLAINLESEAGQCPEEVKNMFKKCNIRLFHDYHYVVDPRIELDLSNIKIMEDSHKEVFKKVKQKYALEGDFFINSFLLNDELEQYFNPNKFDLLYTCYHHDILLDSDKLWTRLLKHVQIDIMIEGNLTSF